MMFEQIYSNSYNGPLVPVTYQNNVKCNYYSMLSQVLKKAEYEMNYAQT